MKRKIVAILLVVCSLCMLVSCGNDGSSVYENVAFEKLKTFTKVTGIVLNSTTEKNTHETIFTYVTFEDADEKINDYKTYLLKSGFTMKSDLDDKDIVFESDEKTITISFEETDAGTSIDITMPCDEATNELRREAKYEELLVAAEEKKWSLVYDITSEFSSDEIQNFKDVKAYRMFSDAMDPYNKKVFGVAKRMFEEYLEVQPEDKLGAKAYIKECNKKLSKYNGTYAGKDFRGLLNYYMFIKDGMVAFEYDSSRYTSVGYKLGDPVYYTEQLRIEDLDENITSLYTVDYTSYNNKMTYKHDLVQFKNDGFLVNDFKWDILKGVIDTSPFAGEYKKISNDAPDALNTTF
jgi:hypothetical protein